MPKEPKNTKPKSRQYRPSTIRRLDTLSGGQCAAQNCSNKLVARDEATIISEICHIEAASPEGPRYNPKMTDDDRRHFTNLILLCFECHNIIDNKENESEYPVSLLKEWKRQHEDLVSQKMFQNSTSNLQLAISKIASASFADNENGNNGSQSPFDIEAKISFNAIVRNYALINEYKAYYAKINTLYEELEYQGSFEKEKLLRNVRHLYLKTKGKYVSDPKNPMPEIRTNADNILDDIQDSLLEAIYPGSSQEDGTSFAVSIIMVDAFMRCKIMEEPILPWS